MWSMLPKCPIEQLDSAPPLTVHKGEVITLSDKKQAGFDFHLGEWKAESNTFNFLLHNAYYSCNAKKNEKIVIASLEGSLYAIVQWTEKRSGYQTIENCDVFKKGGNWETVCRLGTIDFQSVTVVRKNLYLRNDGQMCKVALVTEEEVENKTNHKAAAKVKEIKKEILPVSNCSKPPHSGSTLHAIKDTLFSFGGRDKDNQPTSEVLQYNPDTDTWESAGYMRSARYNVAVATMNQAENLDVIVIGGSFGSSQYVMKPRLYTETKTDNKQDNKWEDATSIVEKCAAVE